MDIGNNFIEVERRRIELNLYDLLTLSSLRLDLEFATRNKLVNSSILALNPFHKAQRHLFRFVLMVNLLEQNGLLPLEVEYTGSVVQLEVSCLRDDFGVSAELQSVQLIERHR